MVANDAIDLSLTPVRPRPRLMDRIEDLSREFSPGSRVRHCSGVLFDIVGFRHEVSTDAILIELKSPLGRKANLTIADFRRDFSAISVPRVGYPLQDLRGPGRQVRHHQHHRHIGRKSQR